MKRIILPFIILTLFLGGCFDMSQSGANENESGKAKQDDKQKRKNAYEKKNFVPIQDYTGEGYTLRGANPKTGKTMEAVVNVGGSGNGYANSYYFVAPAGKVFNELYQLYEENPNITKAELEPFFQKVKLIRTT